MLRLHLLRAFVEIADAGSFTGAAERLTLTQSSLSHAIAELERELKAPVFLRGRQGAELTSLGQRILPHAREILNRTEQIRAEASESGSMRGRLRIGAIPSVSATFLPRAIAQFSRRFPNVKITFFEEPSQDYAQLVQWVRDRTIDLAILELPCETLSTVPLFHDELCAVVPASSPLSARKSLRISELDGQPFVMSRYVTERLVRAAYSRSQTKLTIRFEVQELGTLVNLIREGLGISMLSQLAMPTLPEGISLVPLSPPLQRTIGIAAWSFDELSPAAAAFVEMTQESRHTQSRRMMPSE